MLRLSNKQRNLSCLIFFTALILRLLNIIEVSATKPFYKGLLIDAQAYDTWGQQIAGGNIIGKGVFYQDPLYPYFLGLIYSIFGHNLFAVLILQSIIGAVSTLLVFLIGSRLVNKHVGLIAALLWAFHPTIIFYEGLIMKEGLAVFLILFMVYELTIANESQQYKHWCFAGIALGLSALVRGNILLIIPFMIIWLFFEEKENFLRFSLAFVIGLLIVIMPVAIRNKLVGGGFVLTTSQAGANFYWGNNENSTGTLLTSPMFVRSKPPYEKEDFASEAVRLTGKVMSDSEISRFWLRKGIEFILQHPRQYLKLQYQKLQLLLNNTELSDNYQYYYYNRFSALPKYSPVSYGLICSFGLLGMVLSIRNWKRLFSLYIFVTAYSLALMLFLISTRYRLPMVPILTIFAAVAVYWIWEKLSKKEFSSLGYATTILVLFSFFAWKDVPWVTQWNKVDVMALEGFELIGEGDIDTATSKFKEVIRLSPLDYDGHVGLGEIYLKKKRYLDAASEFEISLKEEPRSALLYNKIGLSYIYAGDFDKGIEVLYKSIELKPNQSPAYYALSIAFGEKGLYQESQKYLTLFKKYKGENIDY